jgi:cytosine/adenosine deaminase-related metal-dependent hydrolase
VDQEHNIYQPGFVAIKADKIAALGHMYELPAELEAAKIIDAKNHVVMPGLVDGHGHAGHCLIKTLAESSDGPDGGWWGQMAEDIYFRYTDEFFWQAEGALAAAERLKFGITTGVSMLGSTPRPDHLGNLEAHFNGAIKTGIRQISGLGACDGPWPKKPRIWRNGQAVETTLTPQQMVANTEESVKKFNGLHKRQICLPMPGNLGIDTNYPEDREFAIWKNREMGRIAQEYNLPLHTHIQGGGVQFVYDTTPEILGPHTSLTHSTALSQREIEIFAETGAVLMHGPTTRSNIRARCPVYEVLRAGGEVVIVTDGTAPDRSYDIWRDMKIFQVLHRAHENDSMLAPAGRVLEMCTIRPAKAFDLDKKIGTLEEGKQADLILVNVRQPHLAPFGPMPVQRLVYHAQGQDVDTVIIDGQLVMEERKLLLVNEEAILDDAEGAYNELADRLGSEMMAALTDAKGIYDLRAQQMANPYKR